MKNLKYYIIAFIVVVFIAIISIIIVVKNNVPTKKNDGKDTEDRDFVIEKKEATKGKIQSIDSISDYELARVCLQKFYENYIIIFDENIINADKDYEYNLDYYKTKLAEIMTDEYKDKYGIDSSNINQKLKKCNYDYVEIYKIYYATNYGKTKVFFIKGLLRNTGTLESEPFENTLYIDNTNQLFKVSLENDLNVGFDDLKPGDEVAYVIPELVWSGTSGEFTYPSTSYQEFAKRIFDNIRVILLHNQDVAYSLLAGNSKAKFSSANALKEYVDSHKRDFFLMTFGNYETTFTDDIFTIKVYDSYNKYVITMYFDSFSTFTFDIEEL